MLLPRRLAMIQLKDAEYYEENYLGRVKYIRSFLVAKKPGNVCLNYFLVHFGFWQRALLFYLLLVRFWYPLLFAVILEVV